LVIPAKAIERHGQVASVYVVQNGVARVRLIQVGTASPAGVEVLAGLDAGESVVISPPTKLMDGGSVAIGEVAARTGGAP
jgi:HlyD family secretion protein